MELFLWEHKRLWKRRSTQISVCLCLIYVVVFGCILSYQWFTFGSSTGYGSFDNQFDGYTNIRASQQYAEKFGGVLTDETLQEMVRDYQAISARDGGIRIEQADWQKVSSWVSQLYPELRNPEDYRLPIYLFYFQELSTQEIAKVLAIRPGAVRMRLTRGREQLREKLKGDYFDESGTV